MDVKIPLPLGERPRSILQRAGYGEHTDPRTQKTSYSLRLGSHRYPRFHCYIHESSNSVTFSLHIDQKEASYQGTHMHAGEYEGPLVEEELGRIKRWALAGTFNPSASPASEALETATPRLPSSPLLPKKQGWLSRLFGSKPQGKTEEE